MRLLLVKGAETRRVDTVRRMLQDRGMIMLITGGVKAGKSRRALEIARTWQGSPVSFIATAEVLDEEMRCRIERHREERESFGGFVTIEEPVSLDTAIAAAGQYAVVDCIPMWVNNLMYHQREADFARILGAFIGGMKNCIVVSNETGLGNIPFDAATRRYNLLLAEANRNIAAVADTVEFMVAGIPLRVK